MDEKEEGEEGHSAAEETGDLGGLRRSFDAGSLEAGSVSAKGVFGPFLSLVLFLSSPLD